MSERHCHGTIPRMEGVRQGNSVDAAAVNRALAGTRLAGTVRHFAEVESTNDLALAAAGTGERCGAWIADAQTAGRGRGGHRWHSAPGDGLYVTALFTPRLPASTLEISLLAGLAAWEAIQEVSGLTADIRWPNDLVTREAASGNGVSRKLGGVLAETAVYPAEAGNPATLRYAVIGIGINVAHRKFPPELENMATSLFLEGWQVPDRQPLLVSLLRKLDRGVEALESAFAAHSGGRSRTNGGQSEPGDPAAHERGLHLGAGQAGSCAGGRRLYWRDGGAGPERISAG